MFIAHVPAAYIIARLTSRKTTRSTRVAFLIGSILPDIDMIWFYMVDDRQHHHHSYLTHKPILWGLVCLLGLIARRQPLGRAGFALGLGGLLHMALDSVVGQVTWVWPFSAYASPLVTVPATQSWWVMSFLLHWTFAIEVALTCGALYLWWQHIKLKNPSS